MVATRLVTVNEFASMLLEGLWELVDGEMIELSPNAGRSGWIGGQFVTHLTEHVRPRRLGWVFPADTGFILFDDRRHTCRATAQQQPGRRQQDQQHA